MAESFNNVSQNTSRYPRFQGQVLSFPILGNCSGRDVSFHQIWNIEVLYVSKRQRQTGKLTQSAKFSTITETCRAHWNFVQMRCYALHITSASLCVCGFTTQKICRSCGVFKLIDPILKVWWLSKNLSADGRGKVLQEIQNTFLCF